MRCSEQLRRRFACRQDVPLVIPEVNPDHLALIEQQCWRKKSGGYHRDESELLGDRAGGCAGAVASERLASNRCS